MSLNTSGVFNVWDIAATGTTTSTSNQLRNITSAEEIVLAASVDDLKLHWPTDILSMPSPYTVRP